MFDFPTVTSNDTEQSLKKVQTGRIDAYIWAPEADGLVRQLKLGRIHREKLDNYDDPIIVANSPRGKQVAEILDKALKELRASGRLQLLYAPMHAPYEVWQPHEMGW